MKYYNMTNNELLNTYNASAEYDPALGCTKNIITRTVKTLTA